jgi:exopolysaccharide production protein ExoQ
MYEAVAKRSSRSGGAVPSPERVPMRPLERAFHLLALVTQFGGIVPLYLYFTGHPTGVSDVGTSTPINTAVNVLILAVSVVMALRYSAEILRGLPSLTPVLFLLALCLLSALWSTDAMVTIRHSGTAITIALWSAYLASRFSLRDIVILVAQAIMIVAVASLIVTPLFPGIGIDNLLLSDPTSTPGWKGILSDKNSLGIEMAAGAATMLYLMLSPGGRRRDRAYWLVSFALCMVLLYLSQSRTSWLAAAAGIVTCFVVRAMYRRPAIGLVTLSWIALLGIPAVLFAINDLGTLTALLGKSPTLTGRVELWQVVLPYGAQKPWFGYGYGAFWIADSPLTQEIWRILNSYHPPHAHNGWIEIYLELGLAGCVLVALQLVQMLAGAWRAVTQGRDIDAPYVLVIVVMILLFNIVEADLIWAPALFWPFLTIGPIALSRIARRARRAAPTRPPLHPAPVFKPVGRLARPMPIYAR